MMSRRLARVANVVLILCAGVVLGVKLTTVASARQATRAAIAAPEKWIPVSADYVESSLSSPQKFGRFWRDGNGSTRLETGPSLSDLIVVDIKNIPNERWYQSYGQAGWTEQPMKLDGEYAAPRLTRGGFDSVPARSYEGRAAVQRTTRDGRIQVLVPDLNFLVVDSVLPNGSRIMLRNITTDRPIDPSLFLPPPDAQVKFVNEAGGILRFRASEIREMPTKQPN